MSSCRSKCSFLGYESFSSVDDFRSKLRIYGRRTGSSYNISSSITALSQNKRAAKKLPPSAQYYFVQFKCVHSGKKVKTREQENNRRYFDHNCPASICLQYDCSTERMKVSSINLNHNHTLFASRPEIYSNNRQLTEKQKEVVFDIMGSFSSGVELRKYIKDRFHVVVTHYDLRNLKRKHREQTSVMQPRPRLKPTETVETLLKGNSTLKIVRCEETRRLKMVSFALPGSEELYSNFGEVLLMNTTSGCNQGAYHLWQVMITDCYGKCRSVFSAFMENESAEMYELAFRQFVAVFVNIRKTETVILDQYSSQLQAVKHHHPAVKLQLCTFGVLRTFWNRLKLIEGITDDDRSRLYSWSESLLYVHEKKHFDLILMKLSAYNAEYMEYIQRYWLNRPQLWAGYFRNELFDLDNATNNLMESSVQHLKQPLRSAPSLTDCVKTIINWHTQQEDDYRSHVAHATATDVQTKGCKALSRLTEYARSKVLNNMSTPVEVLQDLIDKVLFEDGHIVTVGTCLKCTCTFHNRWRLPCTHIVCVCSIRARDIGTEMANSRWLNPSTLFVPKSTTVVREIPPMVDVPHTSRSWKSVEIRQVIEHLSEALLKLDGDQYIEQMKQVYTYISYVHSLHDEVNIPISEFSTDPLWIDCSKDYRTSPVVYIQIPSTSNNVPAAPTDMSLADLTPANASNICEKN